MSYIIALDQGTTSSRALLFDGNARPCGVDQMPFEQHFPHPGWVEHDPYDILESQVSAMRGVMESHNLTAADIDGIGISNQRETTIMWNARTGEPLCNAIVWQCRRTADVVDQICSDKSVRDRIVATTGLVPDAYFSASKIKWILDNVEGAREAARQGNVLFGTVDTWLIWNLTAGAVHATDYTNASRTMLFDIHKGTWDPWLLDLFGIPASVLPQVRPSSGDFGVTAAHIPGRRNSPISKKVGQIPAGIAIRGVAGDQQAALFGQCATQAGQAKSTYGTGCFVLMHTGQRPIASRNNLVTTIAACTDANHLEYALEGSVFMAGAIIQWLRDELGLIDTPAESETLSRQVDSTEGVYVVPAFTGLGAPYWDPQARGAIYGLTRGTTRAHIVRAALESIAYQAGDVMRCMQDDSGVAIELLAVDGGACRNDFLMQFQADILDSKLQRPDNIESSAAGAAYLAGLVSGFWRDIDQVRAMRGVGEVFEPTCDAALREMRLAGWHACIERTRT